MACKCVVDVHYDEERDLAHAAAVVFSAWDDSAPIAVDVRTHVGLAPYVAGEFYRRELPALLPLLGAVEQRSELALVIVDAHVDLGTQQAGLGRHLFAALEGRLTVVGIAKNEFPGAPAQPVRRGRSNRPLWVSSTSRLDSAVRGVRAMHGPHRLPTLLKLVDQRARAAMEQQE